MICSKIICGYAGKRNEIQNEILNMKTKLPQKELSLIYVTASTPFSPEETFILPEIAEIQNRGHQLTVVPVRLRSNVIHQEAKEIAKTSVRKGLISLSIIGGALGEFIHSPRRAIESLYILAKSRSIRIFLKNLMVFPKGLWLSGFARKKQIDHIHAHWASTSATMAFISSYVSGIPWSFTAHRWDITENNLLKEKAETASFIRTIDIQGQIELENFIPDQRNKISVIHMGVYLDFRSGKKIASEDLRVIIGARLVEVKGHIFALEAIPLLKKEGVKVFLDIVGEGQLMSMLKERTKELEIEDCVRFLGLIDHHNLTTRLAQNEWDIALLPSIVTKDSKEGIPVFLIEAMAAGIPVISTNTGGIPELLAGGVGILIPEKEPRKIAEAIRKLGSDIVFQYQFSETGRKRIAEDYDIKSVVTQLLKKYFE